MKPKEPPASFEFSLTGQRIAAGSGIHQLMDDLGRALATGPGMRMLGGGNPAPVPALQALLRQRMRELLEQGESFDRVVGNYDPPSGNPRFRAALAELFQRSYGWGIGPQNIAVTSGGQSAYFFLFNMLAGAGKSGRRKKILLPVAPEYIGYAESGNRAGYVRLLSADD
jgi:valine--pyruvate aminotransferase